MRAQLAVTVSWGGDVSARLLEVAKRLEPIDANLSRMTYLDAIYAAVFAGRFAAPGADVAAATQAVVDGPPPPGTLSEADQILDGLTANFSQVGAPFRRVSAMRKIGNPCAFPGREMRWLSLATIAAVGVWDDHRWAELTDRYIELCRQEGTVNELLISLTWRTFVLLFAGTDSCDVGGRRAAGGVEGHRGQPRASAVRHSGARRVPWPRGRTSVLLDATLRDASQRGEGAGITIGEWASAVLNNGRGHYQAALAAAQRATEYTEDLSARNWALAELVEAAVRSGETESSRNRLPPARPDHEGWAPTGRSASRPGHARCSPQARKRMSLYQEAIERLGRTSVRAEVARAHLLYGEWLRRERRRGGCAHGSCGRRMGCSRRWACRRSPSGQARAVGDGRDRAQAQRGGSPGRNSTAQELRSPGWRRTG